MSEVGLQLLQAGADPREAQRSASFLREVVEKAVAAAALSRDSSPIRSNGESGEQQQARPGVDKKQQAGDSNWQKVFWDQFWPRIMTFATEMITMYGTSARAKLLAEKALRDLPVPK